MSDENKLFFYGVATILVVVTFVKLPRSAESVCLDCDQGADTALLE
ncbi:MAG: hypothetical protein AAGG51_06795 [Cyanobacteria bacterium P01_G01_bin.54]